ncbi:LuxR C-terminal-related transcriptional regulator [Amycolatopsis sp. YIM 10]|uniref:LuxR C-terminal-related transcriptional regulator n=1 Tax=Amycolatopsis sp. YIM 10 TaxID=2653857 RepID=UPI0012906D6F|nr:LuxR C-terminal-related transcriptional regulator [Amycolatopsis sp. YIM 10]QFU88932.1 Bacterial regulatory protein, LuxR family [Amycolatopsis sp. YIM 10]
MTSAALAEAGRAPVRGLEHELTVDTEAQAHAEKSGLMVCLDSALRIQQANQEFFRQFGMASADVCGRGFTELVHPSMQQALRRQFAGLVEGKRHRFAAHVVLVRAGGVAFPATLTGVAVRGGAPEVGGGTTILVMMRPAQGAADAGVVTNRKKILSEMDARILEGIAAGFSTIPLASRLYLSRQGVEYHVSGLLRKLKVPNRAALVSRAYSMGVLNVGIWPPKVVDDFVK